jgi:adenylosuccinate lyase
MPHKKNPITVERLRGMSSLTNGYLVAAIEQQMTYDERAIDQSSVERVIWPDMTILLHYMLESMTFQIENFVFFPEKMLANLEAVQGIWASQYVKNALWDKGIYKLPFFEEGSQEDGVSMPTYVFIQTCAFVAWDKATNTPNRPLKEVLRAQMVHSFIGEQELDLCFDVDHVLRNADVIYDQCKIPKCAW